MNALRFLTVAGFAIAAAGCTTVIIRPAKAPECTVPAILKDACSSTAKLGDQVTYGDLPGIALNVRQDFAECRNTYIALMHSYEICVDGLKQFNQNLKKLEEQVRNKYKDAEVIED